MRVISTFLPFIRYVVCKHFIPVCACLSLPFSVSFEELKLQFLILIKSSLSICCFMNHAFGVVSYDVFA